MPKGVSREDELVIDELVEAALASAGGLGINRWLIDFYYFLFLNILFMNRICGSERF